jgi:hypothetical protein
MGQEHGRASLNKLLQELTGKDIFYPATLLYTSCTRVPGNRSWCSNKEPHCLFCVRVNQPVVDGLNCVHTCPPLWVELQLHRQPAKSPVGTCKTCPQGNAIAESGCK